MTMQERRSEPRWMCADLVKTRIIDGARAREVIANLEDISPSGACLQLDEGAAVGAAVEILCASCRLKGTVRYCRFGTAGYDVGVAFDTKRAWNQKRFSPKHLLDIACGGPGSVSA